MSAPLDLEAIRAQVATALNTADGVKASATYRQIARKGEALVRFDNAVRDVSGFGWIVTVNALVALPNALKDAEPWVDAHLDGIVQALSTVMVVGNIAPVQLSLDAGIVPALQVTGTLAA